MTIILNYRTASLVELRDRTNLENGAYELLVDVRRALGGNPFRIAADQGLSIAYHGDECSDASSHESGSLFRPDALAIDLYPGPLTRYWEALFPGCEPKVRYRFACWRELWRYWLHAGFAPLRSSLGDAWHAHAERFRLLSATQQAYLGHYFAAVATGVMACGDDMPDNAAGVRWYANLPCRPVPQSSSPPVDLTVS